MKAYLNLVNDVLTNGLRKENRTGVDTYSISGAIFSHDMSEGFPLLTTKKMAKKAMKVELEGFIKGITDKKWYQERGCNIWNGWCNPSKVSYGHDEETKEKMKNERDLGPIYGFQWRHWDAEYDNYNTDYNGKGIDQFSNMLNELENNPNNRRILVNAWNPKKVSQMALPPCHYNFQTLANNGKLDLLWNQRSVDLMLGLPFNIASYGLLLHLIAKETGLKEGKLIGFLADTHIYEPHLDNVKKQLSREPFKLPQAETKDFDSIFNWEYSDTKFENYNPHPTLKFEVAV